MKRKIAALILCAVLLLPVLTSGAQRSLINFYDDSVVRQRNAVVYCLSKDGYRLVPEVRTVSIFGSETILDVLAAEVLNTPQSEKLVSAMGERVRLQVLSVAQTGKVATVDLGGDVDILQMYELFCLKAALVNTLIETGQVEYVNVLFDGHEIPTNDLPTGTLTRFDEDLQSAWIEHENEGVAAVRSPDYTFKRNVTLYFASKNSDLLLAEVRQIAFTRYDLSLPVIKALITGPFTDTELRRSYPSSVTVLGIPDFEYEDENTCYLSIDFSYDMGNAFLNEEERRIQFSPLVMTLTTFLPETDAVLIRVNRRPVEGLAGADSGERLLYRSQFSGMVGRIVELYYPDEAGGQVRVTRAVEQKKNTLRDLIEQLLSVPEEGRAVFPEGFDASHLRGVSIVDDIAVVNLTREGAELVMAMPPEQAKDCVFCIVNTLTSAAGISRVQFLVEGCHIDEPVGELSLRSPLVRNPGVIRATQN